MRQLDRGHTDAAGSAMDQGLLAAFQPARLEQIGPHREACLWQRAGAYSIEIRRPGQALQRGRGAVFGIAAAVGQRTDPVADFPSCHAASHGDDLARDLEPKDRRRAGWRWVGALALRDVWAVYAGGHDADQDLVRPRN